MPARNSVKLLTRRQNESHGGPRSPCACCGNWEIRGPVNPADREARALRGPPWFSFCLRVKSFLCRRRARQCQVPIGCRSQRRHSRISIFPVRHAHCSSISLRRLNLMHQNTPHKDHAAPRRPPIPRRQRRLLQNATHLIGDASAARCGGAGCATRGKTPCTRAARPRPPPPAPALAMPPSVAPPPNGAPNSAGWGGHDTDVGVVKQIASARRVRFAAAATQAGACRCASAWSR